MTSKDKIRKALADEPKDFYRLMTDTGLSAQTLNKHIGEMLEAGDLVESVADLSTNFAMVKLELAKTEI